MIYADLTSPELGRIAPKTIAVLPLASIEQHGNHLPVCTDTAIVTELAARVEAKLPKLVAMLPTLWCGSSHHHKGFPGAISLSSDTYIRVLTDIIECLIETGFQRIFLLNGHGGNHIPFSETLNRLNHKYRGLKNEPWIAGANYWMLAGDEIRNQEFMETGGISHACEYETSMMLAIRLDWVKKTSERKAEKNSALKSKYYDTTTQKTSRVVTSMAFNQISDTGALNAPEKGTAKKGEQLFELITPVVVDFLKEFATWKRRKFAHS